MSMTHQQCERRSEKKSKRKENKYHLIIMHHMLLKM